MLLSSAGAGIQLVDQSFNEGWIFRRSVNKFGGRRWLLKATARSANSWTWALPLVSLFRKVRGKLETKWARLPGDFCWITDGRKVRGFDG